ncbi:unnamed protein product [Phytophthora fragariaefolia]|uniref:Unnamed protein product n=1 Tax=Phytophthora fragariaefolia TaxID=1490495 RepID=A0A9W6X4S9_9STRA|nr:unnamed protein product [Phytophthora fragariaefolia]
MQVSHRGKYSIERLIALEEYTRSTSLLRVWLVCLGTPVPIVVLVILQESLPLEGPEEGWRTNWGFWIRAAILGGMTSHGITIQLNYLMQGINASPYQLSLLFVVMAIGYTACSIVVASFWIFPIPFMTLVMTPSFLLLLIGSMRVILGRSTFQTMLVKRDQLQRLNNAVSIQVLMAVLYPAYQVLFNSLSGSIYELPAFLLLPVIKVVLKNLVALCLVDTADLIPENIMFTVHFFNAVYLATCMQISSSSFAVAVVMVIDLTETAITLNSIYRSSASIMKHLHRTIGPTASGGLVAAACALCQCHEKFTKEERSQVQVHSFFPHQITPAGRKTLANLDSCIKPGPRSSNTQSMPTMQTIAYATTDHFRVLFSHQWGALIHPAVPMKLIQSKMVNVKKSSSRDVVTAVPSVQHITTLRKTLSIMFTIECIVLSEYVEFVIPLLYSNYVVMMVNLPSARYHTEMAGVSEANVGSTVQAVIIYGLFELASFVLFIFIVKKSCGIQALYHLAFVLETQMMSIQSKIMGWMLITLGFRVVHFGTLRTTLHYFVAL